MSALLSRSIGPIPVSVIEREKHESTIEITEVPIETGAHVTDHAYRNSNKITLEATSSGAAATYGALKGLQESRQPFTVVTGLYVYRNMLIKALSPERDSRFSTVFRGTIDLQEAIIVGTSYVAGQGAQGAGSPGGANSTRAATPSKARANGRTTQIRASNTIARGDNPVVNAPVTGNTPEAKSNASILHRMFN